MYVNDQGNTANTTYSISASSITRAGAGTISYTSTTVELYGGGGSDTYNIAGTSSAAPLLIESGNANDLFDVCPTTQNLANIQGALTLWGQGGNNVLNLYDNNDTAATTYSLTSTTVTSSSSAAITYSSMNTVNLSGGSNNDTYNIESTGSGTAVAIARRRRQQHLPGQSHGREPEYHPGHPVDRRRHGQHEHADPLRSELYRADELLGDVVDGESERDGGDLVQVDREREALAGHLIRGSQAHDAWRRAVRAEAFFNASAFRHVALEKTSAVLVLVADKKGVKSTQAQVEWSSPGSNSSCGRRPRILARTHCLNTWIAFAR